MRKAHVIFVSEDGVASLVCGVGSVTRHFVSGFPDLAKELMGKAGIEPRLSLISHKPDEGAVGIRTDLLDKMREIYEDLATGLYKWWGVGPHTTGFRYVNVNSDSKWFDIDTAEEYATAKETFENEI